MGAWPENGRFLFCTLFPALVSSGLQLFCAQFLIEVFLILSPRLSSISYPKFLIFREKVSFNFLRKYFSRAGAYCSSKYI